VSLTVSPLAFGSILWPMLAQIGWTFFLYAWLTLARQRAVRRGEVDHGCFVLGREEPREVARITRNLANQWELPALFYALVVLLVATDRVTTTDVAAAWVSSPAASCIPWCRP
jgi:hypothetical protein